MNATITVEALAAEVGIAWADVASRTSALCRELGTSNVLATPSPDTRRWVLHGTAADLIRDDLATADS